MWPELADEANLGSEAAATLGACEVVALGVESIALFSSFVESLVPVCFEDDEALFSPLVPASSVLHYAFQRGRWDLTSLRVFLIVFVPLVLSSSCS